jgi:glycerol-3-phosphate acyltransferase PlsY
MIVRASFAPCGSVVFGDLGRYEAVGQQYRRKGEKSTGASHVERLVGLARLSFPCDYCDTKSYVSMEREGVE